jgi:ABC transporter substrate binding protein (PQQ-dependent alcohol dehydrogenase system)
MIIKGFIDRRGFALLVFGLAACSQALPAKEVFPIVYLQRAEDPFYAQHRVYTGLKLRDRNRPIAGAKVAIRDSRVLGRAMGLGFKLVEQSLSPGENPAEAVEASARDQGSGVFLLDLPLDDVTALASALETRNLILFNVRHGDDRLRGAACASNLFHTLPSNAMLMDGLAQFLFKKRWRDVLLLVGQEEADQITSEAFQRSAKKFRLDVVDVRPFVLKKDPRARDQHNIALLTGGKDYDAVLLADSVGEFGRYVPFNTQRPRPVVGSEGLTASAWHWTWERHGAPQLNQRFDKIAKRSMESTDFAAWAAVKAVVEAVVRGKTTDIAALRALLRSDDFKLDTYKGVPGSFRPWSNQLRQAVLLHTHNAVSARAPLDGFLHRKNTLDTLGMDERESRCKM